MVANMIIFGISIVLFVIVEIWTLINIWTYKEKNLPNCPKTKAPVAIMLTSIGGFAAALCIIGAVSQSPNKTFCIVTMLLVCFLNAYATQVLLTKRIKKPGETSIATANKPATVWINIGFIAVVCIMYIVKWKTSPKSVEELTKEFKVAKLQQDLRKLKKQAAEAAKLAKEEAVKLVEDPLGAKLPTSTPISS
jgi:amino acid transporter